MHLQRRHFTTWLGLSGLCAGLAPTRGQSQTPPAIFKTVRVSSRAYALVGELSQRSPTNLGNNMTCGFVLADDGVALIDAGGSTAGARAIEQAVRAVTTLPIRWVINSGGQDHRWFGNDYWQRQHGARVNASAPGLADMKARGLGQFETNKDHLGAAFADTVLAYPDVIFQQRHTLKLAGVTLELIESGGAHTAADIFIHVPQDKLVFSGDIVFADRLLGVMPGMGLRWIAALERLRDELKPVTVVPGHGQVCTLDKALKDSLGYLTLLRDGAAKAFQAGAFDPVEAAQQIDQSPYAYLANYDDARFRSNNAIRMAELVFKSVG